MKLLKLLSVSLLSILSIPVILTTSLLGNSHDDFHHYIKTYQKQYTAPEYHHRFQIFQENINFINSHNSKGLNYTLNINEFADLTHAEFKEKYLPGKLHHHQRDIALSQSFVNFSAIPSSLDWRISSGNPKSIVAVTGVKNQQQCGSCWSFSASGATEGAWALSGNGLVSLSEQELVDCSTSYGNNGCSGGLMDDAFKYIMAKGLCTETSYPYTATDGTCKTCTAVAHLAGYHDVASGDENGLLNQIQLGPVSVAIEADQAVFQFYSGGVLNDASCGTNLDHGVLAVGYGSLNNQPYWIVKNSWGSSWGMNGYVLLSRGNNMCGISQMASRPYYTNSLGFDWSLLWQCVGSCGGGVIEDVIKCAGDTKEVWKVMQCVSEIVGTFSSCGKCVCRLFNDC